LIFLSVELSYFLFRFLLRLDYLKLSDDVIEEPFT
jgi:hypothetical protein